MTIAVSEARAAECREAGGCAYVSAAEVAAAMHQAYMLGAQEAAQAMADGLDSQGCKRGSI